LPVYYGTFFKCDACEEEQKSEIRRIAIHTEFIYQVFPVGWTMVSDETGEKFYCPKHEILISDG